MEKEKLCCKACDCEVSGIMSENGTFFGDYTECECPGGEPKDVVLKHFDGKLWSVV